MDVVLRGGHCIAVWEGEPAQCPPSSGSAAFTGVIPAQKCLCERHTQVCVWYPVTTLTPSEFSCDVGFVDHSQCFVKERHEDVGGSADSVE